MSERASKKANTHSQVGGKAIYLIFPKRVQTSPSEHLKFFQASPNELTSGRAFDERDELTSFCPKTGALNTLFWAGGRSGVVVVGLEKLGLRLAQPSLA